ncbi:dinitrogenase iron-molybdenum cofactor biosynthesis protein [candidate division KSB3 bacterium]|uniref:Dinitrogenase iron-molybdenum cofactor biosynthesis protein n=1 Tax=candidate division KSB3 bacterium TaxID=2044937 RepID=A0A9D5Q700_9BACT|nr:dinitrogenase iron-molybdenum cofactor biosynthesis protein [candidate division KSB3 bacterium]MBD3326399.1 dinitrogenase iron-molybdenum cofactor biosynthesis protein [candidate division KSB3 bacterium]
MKICIPTLEDKGLASAVSSHFGRASLFAIVNEDTDEVNFIPNNGQHHGGGMTPAQIIGQHGVDVVLCSGLGVKAVRLFEQQGIHVYCNASGTVADALKAYRAGQLPEATDATACQHHAH